MDKSEVKRIVEANIDEMMRTLGVQHWSIAVSYEQPENPDWAASCERHLDYHKAIIKIAPDKADSEAGVLNSLRHELLHVVLAPFDLYREAMFQLISDRPEADRLDSRMFRFTIEQMVLNLERMLDHGFNYKPGKKEVVQSTQG